MIKLVATVALLVSTSAALAVDCPLWYRLHNGNEHISQNIEVILFDVCKVGAISASEFEPTQEPISTVHVFNASTRVKVKGHKLYDDIRAMLPAPGDSFGPCQAKYITIPNNPHPFGTSSHDVGVSTLNLCDLTMITVKQEGGFGPGLRVRSFHTLGAPAPYRPGDSNGLLAVLLEHIGTVIDQDTPQHP